MRMRNNPRADEILAENSEDLIVLEPQKNKGKWREFFGNDNPIYIEVGMGKGDFISNNALLNKDINYIGIELSKSVVVVAINKFRAFEKENGEIKNLRMMSVDASTLLEVFEENEVDKIFLNFSDPWPRKKHAKRRLTYKTFLDIYKKILKEDGIVEFKTDNRGLFEFSIESMNNYGMNFEKIFLDLHKTEEPNILTEYERKFCELGPIYKMVAKF